MKKIIYSKYNYDRAPEFQTKTVICEVDGKRHIEKTAITESAKAHISTFEAKYEKAKNLYSNIELLQADVKDETVIYPYLEGESIQSYLKRRVHSMEELFDELKALIDRLYQVSDAYQCRFEKSDEFSAMFGEADCTDMLCVKPCNMDLIFDNIIISADGRYQAYDYEWVCDCAVPQKYVIYRVLCNFYEKHFEYLSPKYTFDEYISKFDFNDHERSVYRRMEDSLMQYVYAGGNPVLINGSFHAKRVEFDELMYKYKDYDHVMSLYLDTLDSFTNSTSWKITRPVRAVKDCVSGLRERMNSRSKGEQHL
jgi:hypothetical protein